MYAPANAEHYAFIAKSKDYFQPAINLSRVFDIPDMGARALANLLKERDQKLEEIDEDLQPQLEKMQAWMAPGFGSWNWADISWLKPVLITTGLAALIIMILYIAYRVKGRRCCCTKTPKDPHQQEDVYIPMTRPLPQTPARVYDHVSQPFLHLHPADPRTLPHQHQALALIPDRHRNSISSDSRAFTLAVSRSHPILYPALERPVQEGGSRQEGEIEIEIHGNDGKIYNIPSAPPQSDKEPNH